MDSEGKKFGRGPRELTGAVDLMTHYKLLPHHEFFCKKSLPVPVVDTQYLYNVVGDTEIRKGEGMQSDELIQNASCSQDGNARIQPFDIDALREAFHLKETAPVELPSAEKGIPTIAGKSKSESKDKDKKQKKHKDRDKEKDKEHKKHKHRHKDRSKDKDKEKKKDKSGHQDSGGEHSKKHHEKKRKHDDDEDANDIHRHKKSKAVPVVDGNVVRVLARLKAISANPKDSATIKKFWRLAGQLVDPCRPGDFNQALMELGAIICTPTSSSCSKCPVSLQCHALSLSQQGGSTLVTDFPQKAVKVKQRNEYSAVCVVEISESSDLLGGVPPNSKYLLVKRPDEGLLAGLWEFPSVLLREEAELSFRRKVIDDFLKKTFNLNSKKTCKTISRDDVGDYLHIFSHIRLKMYVELLVIHIKGGLDLHQNALLEGSMAWKCVDSKELSSMGLTSGVRKVYTMIQKFKQKSLSATTKDTEQPKSRKRR